jgi:hypothetical protein
MKINPPPIKPIFKSHCCKAGVDVAGDVTKYYVCSNCLQPCDAIAKMSYSNNPKHFENKLKRNSKKPFDQHCNCRGLRKMWCWLTRER